MVDQLVMVDGNKVITTTLIIAEGVVSEHRAVMALLKKHSTTKTLSTFQMSKVSRGGRPVEFAKLTEQQATFLVTLMRNSERVVEFKEKLTIAFFQQRSDLSNWQHVRKDGKAAYFQKTDVIKEFVEYATAQGSKSASMYYGNLAKMENKALFFFEQKYKNLREVMTIKQLMQVAIADDVVEKALMDGMKGDLNYKSIYVLAKDRVIAFAETIGRSPIKEITDNGEKMLGIALK